MSQIVMENKKELVNFKKFTEMKKKLPWPISGRILYDYDQIRNDLQKWKGIVIASNSDQQVRSIANGVIVFSGKLSGYGKMIIIDHGESYLSLYGFNEELYKKVGEIVQLGDTISRIGKLPNDGKKSALYFEIRKGTQPIDPKVWLL